MFGNLMGSPQLSYLWPTLAVLGLAPLLYSIVRRSRGLLAGLDGFVLTSVGGLVLAFLLPPTLEALGPVALAIAALGLLAPVVLEGMGGHRRSHLLHEAGMGLAFLGLLVHSALDGVALRSAAGGMALGVAVALHTLPVSIAVWWAARPAFGVVGASVALISLGVATVAGFGAGEVLTASLGGAGVHVFTALISGMLLHVVAHRPPGAPAVGHDAGARWGELVGAGIGVGVLLALPHPEDHGTAAAAGAATRLLHLSLDAAPALLLGYVLAGLMVVFLPAASAAWLSRGGTTARAARGVAFGLPIPVCSCGVVPLYEGLVRRGVPSAAALSFLVATPELGVDAVLLSFPLLGPDLTVARVVGAAVVALLAGILVGGWMDRGRAPSSLQPEATEPRLPLRERLGVAARYGLVEVVDDTAGWVLAGLAVAAVLEPGALTAWLSGVPGWASVVGAALVGIPLYICASGATPLAAGLLVAGLSPGAALAFLLSGPATNVTTFGVLSRLHGRKVAVVMAGCLILSAVGVGLVVNQIPGIGAGVSPVSALEVGGPLGWACLGVLGALVAGSLWRKGPRRFVSVVVDLGAHGDEGHGDCDHDCVGEVHEHPPRGGATAGDPGGADSCCRPHQAHHDHAHHDHAHHDPAHDDPAHDDPAHHDHAHHDHAHHDQTHEGDCCGGSDPPAPNLVQIRRRVP